MQMMLLHTALEGIKDSFSSINDKRSFTGERREDWP